MKHATHLTGRIPQSLSDAIDTAESWWTKTSQLGLNSEENHRLPWWDSLNHNQL